MAHGALLISCDRDAEAFQPAVGNEVALPDVEQLPRFGQPQRSPAQHGVFPIEEVEIELFAELGILGEPLVAEVGDVIEQPAIEPTDQPDLDWVYAALFGAVAGVTKVEGQLG